MKVNKDYLKKLSEAFETMMSKMKISELIIEEPLLPTGCPLSDLKKLSR